MKSVKYTNKTSLMDKAIRRLLFSNPCLYKKKSLMVVREAQTHVALMDLISTL